MYTALPVAIAALKAAVSSVEPSPFAPKSVTDTKSSNFFCTVLDVAWPVTLPVREKFRVCKLAVLCYVFPEKPIWYHQNDIANHLKAPPLGLLMGKRENLMLSLLFMGMKFVQPSIRGKIV